MTARASANGHRPGPHRPADWSALGSRPGPDPPLLRCGCGAAYHDDDPGRQAHVAVFGHSPRPRQPAEPPKENPSR